MLNISQQFLICSNMFKSSFSWGFFQDGYTTKLRRCLQNAIFLLPRCVLPTFCCSAHTSKAFAAIWSELKPCAWLPKALAAICSGENLKAVFVAHCSTLSIQAQVDIFHKNPQNLYSKKTSTKHSNSFWMNISDKCVRFYQIVQERIIQKCLHFAKIPTKIPQCDT